MNTRVLTNLNIGRENGEDATVPLPIDGWGVHMPFGSEIVAVAEQSGNLAVIALVLPVGATVWHPLLVFPIGGRYEPMLGRKIGRCYGGIGTWMVFQDSPWPQSALEGLAPKGMA